MDTFVTMQIVGGSESPTEFVAREAALDRAFAWFRQIESCCSRFDPSSELRQLSSHVGTPVATSAILFETIGFAVAVALESGGAFDPTIGHEMETRGFARNYATGEVVVSEIPTPDAVSFRDVSLDVDRHTVTLGRPLVLDLGAVAKGLAIDMAARELRPFANFVIDAGGDVYVGGVNGAGRLWSVGIRHPRDEAALLASVHVSDAAVCTSGDYERHADAGHLVDARSRTSARTLSSVTVIAPTAMAADAFGTAAFALGPSEGVAFLERQGVDGLLVAADLSRSATRGWMVHEHAL